MSELQKVASEVPGIIQEAAQHLRKMSSSLVEERSAREAAEHELLLTKMARRLEIRGLESNLSFEEKISKLREFPKEKLSSMEQAIELAAGGVRIGTVPEPEKQSSSTSEDALDQFIYNQEAFGQG